MTQHLTLCLTILLIAVAVATGANTEAPLPGVHSSEWNACPWQDGGGFNINLAVGQRFGCCMEASDWFSQLEVYYWSKYNSNYTISVYKGEVCGHDNGGVETEPEPKLVCRSMWEGDYGDRHRTNQIVKGPDRPGQPWVVTWEIDCRGSTPLNQCTVNVDLMFLGMVAQAYDPWDQPSC